MLAECPKFDGAPSEYTEKGTERHKALADYLAGNENAFRNQSDDYAENLLWAADYIKLKAPLNDHPLISETKRHLILPNNMEMEGTPDFTCGDQIFDLKWRTRDYTAQMACYALMVLDETDREEVTTHLLFAESQFIRTIKFTGPEAWEEIKTILDHVNHPFAAPIPCDFCAWCSRKEICPALTERLNAVITGRPDWGLKQWHASKIQDAEDMGNALRLARCLGEWSDHIEFRARELALKEGIIAKGFKLQTRQGNRYIDDVAKAFTRAGLPQAEFLQACSVRPKGLFELHAKLNGMKLSAAEREMERKLGDAIQRKPSTNALVTDKPTKQ